MILKIIRWVFGLFFITGFFTYVSTGFFAAFLSLILAAMLIPPVAKFIYSKIPYTFSSKALVVLGIALFVVMMMVAPKTASENVRQNVEGASTVIVPTITSTPTQKIIYVPPTATPTLYVEPTTTTQVSGLSNDNYYTNSDGNSVHSPAYANTAPAGATALCGDGTYSFSQHRSGTCSHHQGVAQWL